MDMPNGLDQWGSFLGVDSEPKTTAPLLGMQQAEPMAAPKSVEDWGGFLFPERKPEFDQQKIKSWAMDRSQKDAWDASKESFGAWEERNKQDFFQAHPDQKEKWVEARDQTKKMDDYWREAKSYVSGESSISNRSLEHIPKEDRKLFLTMLNKVAGEESTDKGYLGSLARGVARGGSQAIEGVMTAAQIAGDAPESAMDRRQFDLQARNIARGGEKKAFSKEYDAEPTYDIPIPFLDKNIPLPTTLKGGLGLAAKGSIGAAEMTPMLGASYVAGGTATLATGNPAAGFAAGMAIWTPQSVADVYGSLREAGFSDVNAKRTSAIAGPVIASIEALQAKQLLAPNLTGTIKQKMIGLAGDYAKQMGEEATQEAIGLAAKRIANEFDKEVKIDWKKELGQSVDSLGEAAISLPFLMAPGAIGKLREQGASPEVIAAYEKMQAEQAFYNDKSARKKAEDTFRKQQELDARLRDTSQPLTGEEDFLRDTVNQPQPDPDPNQTKLGRRRDFTQVGQETGLGAQALQETRIPQETPQDQGTRPLGPPQVDQATRNIVTPAQDATRNIAGPAVDQGTRPLGQLPPVQQGPKIEEYTRRAAEFEAQALWPDGSPKFNQQGEMIDYEAIGETERTGEQDATLAVRLSGLTMAIREFKAGGRGVAAMHEAADVLMGDREATPELVGKVERQVERSREQLATLEASGKADSPQGQLVARKLDVLGQTYRALVEKTRSDARPDLPGPAGDAMETTAPTLRQELLGRRMKTQAEVRMQMIPDSDVRTLSEKPKLGGRFQFKGPKQAQMVEAQFEETPTATAPQLVQEPVQAAKVSQPKPAVSKKGLKKQKPPVEATQEPPTPPVATPAAVEAQSTAPKAPDAAEAKPEAVAKKPARPIEQSDLMAAFDKVEPDRSKEVHFRTLFDEFPGADIEQFKQAMLAASQDGVLSLKAAEKRKPGDAEIGIPEPHTDSLLVYAQRKAPPDRVTQPAPKLGSKDGEKARKQKELIETLNGEYRQARVALAKAKKARDQQGASEARADMRAVEAALEELGQKPPAKMTPIALGQEAKEKRAANAEHIELPEALLDKIATLKPGQQDVLIKRLSEGKTLEEVGKSRGVKRQRIEQVEKAALAEIGIQKSVAEIRKAFKDADAEMSAKQGAKEVQIEKWNLLPDQGGKDARIAQQGKRKAVPAAEYAGLPIFDPFTTRERADEIPGPVQADDAEVEGRLQAARGASQEAKPSRIKAAILAAYQGLTRAQYHLADNAQWAKANELFRLLKTIPEAASDQTARDVAKIVDPLGPKQLKLLERKLIAENLLASLDRGEPLRFGFKDRAAVEAYLAKLDKLIEKTPEVQEALTERRRVVDKKVKELVDLGLLHPDALKNPNYYHQQVISKLQAVRMTSGGRKATRGKKGFQKERSKGESFDQELDYNTDYLEAEMTWLTEAEIAIRKEGVLRQLDKKYGVRDQIMKEAATTRRFPDSILKEDFPGYAIWSPTPGNHFHRSLGTVDEAVLDFVQTTNERMGLVPVTGTQQVYVFPQELVDQLQETKVEVSNAAKELADEMMKGWKVWTLFNPKRLIGYMVRNQLGDLDPVIGGAMGVFKQIPGRGQELHDYYMGNTELSPELRAARDLGVISAGMTAAEIPDLKDVRVLQRFYDQQGKAGAILKLPEMWFKSAKGINEFRESMLRYASFLHYRQHLKDGTLRHYGGAKKSVVDALVKDMGVDVAAAHLSRNLMGDYQNLSVAGNWMRKYVAPFWSWQEIAFGRNIRLLTNAVKSGTASENIAAGTAYSAIMTARLATLYGMMWLWNNLVMGDDDEKLSPEERASPHLTMGKNADGSVKVLRGVGAWGDMLEWFGLKKLISLYPKYEANQLTIGDLSGEMAKSPLNKVAQSVRPDVKGAAEIATGYTTYPDVFEPKQKNRSDIAANIVGLEDEVKALRGSMGSGEKVKQGYGDRFFGLATTDPRKVALGEMHDLVRRFHKMEGKPERGTFGSSPTRAMREAASSGDYEAFKDAREQYLKAGHTEQSFKQSISRLDPVANLEDNSQRRFSEKFLTADQRKQMAVSRDYARRLEVDMNAFWKRAAKESPAPKKGLARK